MKKNFVAPEFKVVKVQVNDVICTSGTDVPTPSGNVSLGSDRASGMDAPYRGNAPVSLKW